MPLLVLHRVAHLPPKAFSYSSSLKSPPKHTPGQSCPLGFSTFAGATPSPGSCLPHPWLLKSSWSYPAALNALSSAGRKSTCNAGDLGSIPGLGRPPGEGKGYPLQYSGLENSMDCMYHPRGHKESDTTEQLPLHFTFLPFHWLTALKAGPNLRCLAQRLWYQGSRVLRLASVMVTYYLLFWGHVPCSRYLSHALSLILPITLPHR